MVGYTILHCLIFVHLPICLLYIVLGKVKCWKFLPFRVGEKEIEPRALHVLSTCSSTKLHSQPFCPFLNWVPFFLLKFKGSLYNLDTQLLSDVCFVNIFFKTVTYFFILLSLSFTEKKFLILIKSNLPIFSTNLAFSFIS